MWMLLKPVGLTAPALARFAAAPRMARAQRRGSAARHVLAMAGLTFAFVPTVGATDFTFTRIADDSNGIAGFSVPSINSDGVVAFGANLDGGDQAIYTGTGDGALTTIADTSLGIYFELYAPTINDAGRVAFGATTSESDLFGPIPDAGVYTIADGMTVSIADNELGSPYWGFGSIPQSINATGTVAFFGKLRAPDGFPSTSIGIFAGSGGAQTTIADASAGFGQIFEGTSINTSGTVAFVARRSPSGKLGVFTGMDSASTTVADVDGEFSNFGQLPSINDAGTVAFRAYLDAGGQAIYTGGTSALTPIVATADGAFTALEDPAIDDGAAIAFTGTQSGNVRGIFSGGDPATDKVIAVGDDLFDSSLTDFFFQRGLNANGEIAFRYKTSDGVTGIAVASPTTLTRAIDSGGSYAGVRLRMGESAANVARLRGGVAGGDRSLDLSSEAGGSFAINGARPVGNVLNLAGTENDVFVLELTYDDADLVAAGVVSGADLILQWRDPVGGQFKNSVLGNQPPGGRPFFGSSYAQYLVAHGGIFTLGDYGHDPTTNTVWAVLNHNSAFAAATVPEPGSLGCGLAAFAVLARRRRRRTGRDGFTQPLNV